MADSRVEQWKKALGGDLVRPDNLVTFFIGGAETFKAMYDAMLTANRHGHYIYLLGWWLDIDVSLTGEPRTTKAKNTFRAVFDAASKRGVQIRVMLWDQFGTQNLGEIQWLNELGYRERGAHGDHRFTERDVAAILDDRTLQVESYQIRARVLGTLLLTLGEATSSHHQKVLLIRGERGLMAFCGGVDVNPDRVYSVDRQPGSPMHDVHCRIEGPAAHDLVDVFLRRWQAHPEHVEIDSLKRPVALSDRSWRNRPKKGTQFVRIARNFNFIGDQSKGDFCAGEHSIETVMLSAINNATRFVYIEDQYLGNLRAAEALRKRLSKLQHITIIVPHSRIELVFPRLRDEFIKILKKDDPTGKVRVFYRFTRGPNEFGPLSYIHSKTWVFDDEVAVIGSANCNNRGWGFDSEVIAAIFDTTPEIPSFAQKLRIKLWAMHLGLDKEDESRVRHGFAPEVMRLWDQLPKTANVFPYTENSEGNYRTSPLWRILDPTKESDWEFIDPSPDAIPSCGTRNTVFK